MIRKYTIANKHTANDLFILPTRPTPGPGRSLDQRQKAKQDNTLLMIPSTSFPSAESRGGFTLVELVVTMLIISILAATAIVGYQSLANKGAKRVRFAQEHHDMLQAANMWYLQNLDETGILSEKALQEVKDKGIDVLAPFYSNFESVNHQVHKMIYENGQIYVITDLTKFVAEGEEPILKSAITVERDHV